MKSFEDTARNILEIHGCIFIKMVSESCVMWENQNGIIRTDDVFVLNNMSNTAWDFFKIN